MKSIWLVVLALFALSAVATAHAAARTSRTQRCFLPGLEDAAHCLDLRVPLDWNAPKGKTITIFAAIFPALSRGAHPDPLFIVPGGPGQSGDMLLPLIKTVFDGINKSRDLVLMYPRGTARSAPLTCPAPPPFVSLENSSLARQFKACAAVMKNAPQFFTSSEIIRDTDAIRKALGYTQINLWGGSYGTRLVQHYIAAYPNTVRSAVLDGATRRGQSIFMTTPHAMDVALNGIAIMCRLDSACNANGPDIRTSLQDLLLKLHIHPDRIAADNPLSGASMALTIDDQTLVNSLGLALYRPETRALIPELIRMATRGNYQPIIALAAQANRQLGPAVQSEGHQLSVLCAEDFPYVTREAVSAASRNTVLGMKDYDRMAALCAVWPHGTVAKTSWQAMHSSVPALILSGGLDPVTPPPLGAATAAQFENNAHIIVPASGHGVSLFGCAPRIITAFVDQASMRGIDTTCLTRPKPQAPMAGRNG